ncbi:DKNYY domain-containing protein [Pseudochryseolinea flava]|uniref:DKNYY family protein n=1 Tax=Pseudochryseolinea flava TaxID=2059302 RepID=A0A364Y745_9BACT|nr:DKNYY domain-containing protein [Pseudochryseolinea flava]RAW02217.1 hypothetical protein DQQ10_06655 [Pseudochryseolinea flava]
MVSKVLSFILTPIFRPIFRFLSPLGPCVNKSVSDSYYFSKKSKQELIYSSMGNWFELGKHKFPADALTFIPLANDIGKDKDHIFFQYQPQQVDYTSFNIKDKTILRDKDHVYYRPYEYSHQLLVVEQANPETFTYLTVDDNNYSWSRDAHHYFYYHKKVDVHYPSFKFLTAALVADHHHIYLAYGHELLIKEYVTAPIEKLARCYARMGHTLLYHHSYHGYASFKFDKIDRIKITDDEYILVNNQPIIKGVMLNTPVDTETFETFPDWNYIYARDKNNVYFEGERFASADLDTFEIVGHRYSKDKNHVYYEKEIVLDVDVTKFRIDDNMTATDGKTKFYQGKPEDKSNR